MIILTIEAALPQLRHDGNGDLRKAHRLASKSDDIKATDQPFPDSWLATTAPIALGLLTDIASKFVIFRGKEGREMVWPLVASQYRLWCIGRDLSIGKIEAVPWSPCEALVRIACRELYRLPRRVLMDRDFLYLVSSEQQAWSSLFVSSFSDILAQSVDIEEIARRDLLDLKDKSLFDRREKGDADSDGDLDYEVVQTPFGKGRLVNPKRKDRYPEGVEIPVNVVDLDYGTLFQPLPNVEERRSSSHEDFNSIPSEVEGKFSEVFRTETVDRSTARSRFGSCRCFQFPTHTGSTLFQS